MATVAQRTAALNRTLAKYRAKPFKYGEADCVKLVRFHLRQMGHKPPPCPRYYSLVGARTALRKSGHDSLVSLLDSLLPRIAPAAMLPGDICAVPGTEDVASFEALALCVGQKLAMWHEDAETLAFVSTSGAMPHILAAWRA